MPRKYSKRDRVESLKTHWLFMVGTKATVIGYDPDDENFLEVVTDEPNKYNHPWVDPRTNEIGYGLLVPVHLVKPCEE